MTDVGNVRIAGRYERAQLPELLAAAGGRLALFLHGWPETFSYALAEAVAHGLIPLAPDLGAPAARIRAAKFGHVFAFPIDPGAVLQLILDIASGKVDPTGGNGSPMASRHRFLSRQRKHCSSTAILTTTTDRTA